MGQKNCTASAEYNKWKPIYSFRKFLRNYIEMNTALSQIDEDMLNPLKPEGLLNNTRI